MTTQRPSRGASIALLPGDGIGPEVISAARMVLAAVASRFALTFHFSESLIGGAAIDSRRTPLPDDTLSSCQHADAVLLGAVGGPAWDDPSSQVRPEQGLFGIRAALDVFANLRPVRPYPELAYASPLRPEGLIGVDLLIVRELTGGIYFGAKECVAENGGERASDLCAYSTAEIERIVRVVPQSSRADGESCSPRSTRRTCSRRRGSGGESRLASSRRSFPTFVSSTCSPIVAPCVSCSSQRTST